MPTTDGTAEVKIKPGTQPNDKLRMRGYGVRMDAVGHRGRRGDQYVRILVRMPRSLTAEQRRLLEDFRSVSRGGKLSSNGSSSSSGAGSSSSRSSGRSRSGSGCDSSSSGSSARGDSSTNSNGTKEEKPKKRGWFNFGS